MTPEGYWERAADIRPVAGLEELPAKFQAALAAARGDIHRPGHDTYCSVEGVHEHAFRGPHHFREWDPDAGPE